MNSTEYCNNCGLLHDYDDGECEGCELIAENKKQKELIERIQGMCGTPDATEGCRSILKVIREYNKNGPARRVSDDY